MNSSGNLAQRGSSQHTQPKRELTMQGGPQDEIASAHEDVEPDESKSVAGFFSQMRRTRWARA